MKPALNTAPDLARRAAKGGATGFSLERRNPPRQGVLSGSAPAQGRAMALSDLIAPGGVVADLPGASRKQVLHALAELAHRTLDAPARPILDAVMERERLGSTGVGEGVALPHARTGLVSGACGVFARLKTPVDFDAVDGRPADLIFMLLAPEEAGADHLKALARISRMFRREDFRKALRAAPDSAALNAILAGSAQTDAA